MNPDTSNPAAFAPPGLPQAAPEADSNGSRPGDPKQDAATEDLHYDGLPPRQTVTVSVRYRIRGRGQPLPYALDEE